MSSRSSSSAISIESEDQTKTSVIENSSIKRKFIRELKVFVDFLKDVKETSEINQLLNNFTHLNFDKIANYCYNKTKNDKTDIFSHDSKLFMVKKTYFPTINFSIYFNEMNNDQVNMFWNQFCRIFVYCNIISDNTMDESNISISNLMTEIQEEESNIMPDNLSSLLDTFVDGSKLNEKIHGATLEDFDGFTDQILSMLSKDKDETIKNSINGIMGELFENLQNVDFTKQSLTEVINAIANNIAQKILVNADETTANSLASITRDFIISVKSGDALENLTKDMNPNEKKIVQMTTDFIKKTDLNEKDMGKVLKDFSKYAQDGGIDLTNLQKKHNINDKQLNKVMNNPKNYGIDKSQLTTMNRKIKRRLNVENKI